MTAGVIYAYITQSQGGLRTESCSGRRSESCLQGALPFTRMLCNKRDKSQSCSALHTEMQPPTQIPAVLSGLCWRTTAVLFRAVRGQTEGPCSPQPHFHPELEVDNGKDGE